MDKELEQILKKYYDEKFKEKEEKEYEKLKEDRLAYGFDSLVYRYMKARNEQARLEIEEARHKKELYVKYEPEHYFDRATRDIMRFIQILDDIIGEHK